MHEMSTILFIYFYLFIFFFFGGREGGRGREHGGGGGGGGGQMGKMGKRIICHIQIVIAQIRSIYSPYRTITIHLQNH